MSSARPDLRLDWCSHAAAKYAVEKWHYSRRMPRTRVSKIGVWEASTFIGCVLFNRGANNNMAKPYGLTQFQVAELVRVALRGHKTAVSRIIALALRLLKRQSPGLRLVVSYADPEHGHVGGIYQAGNWIYAGMTSSADEYIVGGTRYHGRALRATRNSSRRGGIPTKNVMEWARLTIHPDVQRVSGSSKYRYLMPLDDEMRAKIAPLARPYPKRAKHPSDAPAVQAGEGGAAPTRTLQEDAG